MKRIWNLFVALGLVICPVVAANADLLVNGNLDTGSGSSITGWTLDQSKTFTGPATDLVTLEPWIEISPITSGGGDADLGGFVKAFQGTLANAATLHMYQDVAAIPGVQYVLKGNIGAGVSFSGLIAGPTQTLLALDFDNDNDPSNGVISSAVTDLKAAGLASGGGPAFGAKEFSTSGVAPAGASVVRARFSVIEMYTTQNPDQAAFIDDFSLTAVPEPATLSLIGLAVAGLVGIRRRSK
jgi:hypothetical protein